MAEDRSGSFLAQAHANNWRMYLETLKPGCGGGWDVCVLTASDECQARMYRRQLEWRREAGLLPPSTLFVVIPDPPGERVGSGGATVRALRLLASEGAARTAGWRGADARVLIIHSGGDSRRLPHASAVGKLFARVPRALPDGRASTVFDEFLISLSGVVSELPPGTLVASGDVLLVFDHLQLSLVRGGVVGVAATASVEKGTRHGVYVCDSGAHSVRAYLHKASPDALRRWGAVGPGNTVQLDTGLVWFDSPATEQLVALAHEQAVSRLWEGGPGDPRAPRSPLNLYADLVLPLAGSTTYDAYLADDSDDQDATALRAAREAIWARLRGTRLTVERLDPAVFVHFGTSREYWRMVAGDPELARTCGWVMQAASWLDDRARASDRTLTVNTLAEAELNGPGLVVTDSQLAGKLCTGGPAIVAGLRSSQDLILGSDVVVHQVPIRGGYVTRVYGLDDDSKLAAMDDEATFANRRWSEWLAEAGVSAEHIWPDIAPGERTLWNACLYPVADTREESVAESLPLLDPSSARDGWRERWRGSIRVSLAESFVLADGERLMSDIAAIEDLVAARRFMSAIEHEEPASEAKALLGSRHGVVERRADIAAEWIAQRDPLFRLRGYKALAEATGSFVWEERAFRTLAATIEESVRSQFRRRPLAVTSISPIGEPVRVEAAARIDFGGGWTDTPPYSIERGGTVLNAAVKLSGRYPIVAEGAWLDEPRLILESGDIDATLEPDTVRELLAYADPADPFALQKAALVLSGLVPGDADPEMPVKELLESDGRGIRLHTETNIPRGSGLGTSSIMAGAVLECVGRMLGIERSQEELFDEVLCLEQMLTTGGGWQDQVGGLVGGVKLVTSGPGLPQRIRIEPLKLSSETEAELAERLVLVYTGQRRLAKNLLRAVMNRWLARDREMVRILEEIGRLALEMKSALESGDVDGFGRLLAEHWELNKRMDPGCTNPFIDEMFERMGPYIVGGKLAGAGGGGFAVVVAQGAETAGLEGWKLFEQSLAVDVCPCQFAAGGMYAFLGGASIIAGC